MRKSGEYIHYGLEMKIADDSKSPMPQLFEQGEDSNPCVAKIKEIVSAMTQFHGRDRPSLQWVEKQIPESHCECYNSQLISKKRVYYMQDMINFLHCNSFLALAAARYYLQYSFNILI